MSAVNTYSTLMHCMQQLCLFRETTPQQYRIHFLAPTALLAWAAAADFPTEPETELARYTTSLSLPAGAVGKALIWMWGSHEQLRECFQGRSGRETAGAVMQYASESLQASRPAFFPPVSSATCYRSWGKRLEVFASAGSSSRLLATKAAAKAARVCQTLPRYRTKLAIDNDR
jgi:hypothetical protein